MPEAECLLQLRTAQIQIAVLEPQFFAHLRILVHRVRQGLRFAEDDKALCQQLHLARRQTRVIRFFVAVTDFALHLNHALHMQRFRMVEVLRR